MKYKKFTFDIVKLIFAIPAAAGIFMVLFGTSLYGPNITHDSVAYIYAANSFLYGKGFVYFGYGTPFIQWPPMLPAILAFLGAMGIEIVNGARYINAVTFGLTIYFSGILLMRQTRYRISAILGCIAIMSLIPLLYVSVFVWSESLFILFTVLYLLVFDIWLERGGKALLVWAGLLAALACLTRYMGVVAVMSGAVILLLRKEKFGKKIFNTLLFGFFSSFPLLLWMIRNYILSSTLTGGRAPSKFTLTQNMAFSLSTVASWFLPTKSLAALFRGEGNILLKLTMAALSAAVVVWILIVIAGGRTRKIEERSYPVSYMARTGHIAIFMFLYIVYLVASATFVAFDQISHRLLAPAGVPLIMLVSIAMDYAWDLSYNSIKKIAFTCLLTALICMSIVYPLLGVVPDIAGQRTSGIGVMASPVWSDSQLMNHLKEFKRECIIYSNYPEAVYMHTGLQARYTPKKEGIELYGIESFKEAVHSSPDSYLAWFNNSGPEWAYSLEELQTLFNMELVEMMGDGVIYRIICE